MKNLKWLLLCAGLACTVLASSAPKPKVDDTRGLVDVLMSVHQFDTFLMLVRDADLTFTLMDGGPYTIFAPTDAAFRKMPRGQLARIHGNKPLLRQFVLHHIVRGSYTAQGAVLAHSLSALDGSTLRTVNVNGHGRVGGAGFALTNVRANNGTLHGIDRALTSK